MASRAEHAEKKIPNATRDGENSTGTIHTYTSETSMSNLWWRVGEVRDKVGENNIQRVWLKYLLWISILVN